MQKVNTLREDSTAKGRGPFDLEAAQLEWEQLEVGWGPLVNEWACQEALAEVGRMHAGEFCEEYAAEHDGYLEWLMHYGRVGQVRHG